MSPTTADEPPGTYAEIAIAFVVPVVNTPVRVHVPGVTGPAVNVVSYV